MWVLQLLQPRTCCLAIESTSPLLSSDASAALLGRVETLLGKASSAALAIGHRPAGHRRDGEGGVGRRRRLVRPYTYPTKSSHHCSRLFMPLLPPTQTRRTGSPNDDDCIEDKDRAGLGRPGRGDQPAPSEELDLHGGRAGYAVRTTLPCKRHPQCDTTTSERLACVVRCNAATSLPESEHEPDFLSKRSADKPFGGRKSYEKEEKLELAVGEVDESASMDCWVSESSKGHLSWARDRKPNNDRAQSPPNRVITGNGQTLQDTDVDSGCRSAGGKSSDAGLRPAGRRWRSFSRRRAFGGDGSRRGRTPSPPLLLCFCRSAGCVQTEKRPHWNSRFWLPTVRWVERWSVSSCDVSRAGCGTAHKEVYPFVCCISDLR